MALLKIKPFIIDDTTANDAFVQANAAFLQANSAASFANGAFDRANSGYDVANTGSSFANGAFGQANSASSFANGAFLVANSGASFANSSFITANSSYASQNTTATFANAAFDAANAAFSQSNTSASFANGAFDRANAAYAQANNSTDTWVRTQANTAYDTANSAASFANGAFGQANSAASFANGAFITANTAYNWGNHASAGYATTIYVSGEIANLVNSAPVTLDTLNELAAALGNDANFSTTITTTLGVTNSFANGAFLRANASYIAQNTTASFANGAFDRANSAASFANGAFVTANSSALFANVAFSHANAAFAAANTGGGGSGSSVTVGSTPPSPAANGYLWYDDTTTGELFVYSSNSWVSTSIMPAIDVNDPVITGPNQANEATTQTYNISNYNGAYAYIISVTGGLVARTNNSIYWTLPSVTTNTTHYMTTQVVSDGVTSAVDTRTVLVVNLNISDAAVIVSDFSSTYANVTFGWA